jgi:hypothetical protein
MRNLKNKIKMVKTRKVILLLSMLSSLLLLIVVGCKKDDNTTPAQRKSYDLKVKDVLGVSGTVTFIETSTASSTIEITIVNAPSGSHPAFLMMNSEVEDGPIALNLNPVDANGKSSTLVSTMTYSQLNAYDGYIKVTKSSNEPGIILAQGDIGGNVITTTNKSYTLDTIGVYGVSGTALFEKRVNGNTLITLTLAGTIQGAVYPASINLGSITSVGGGPVVGLLSNVNGTTGKSFSNIRKLDSGLAITYDNWLVYDGYINIYQSPLTAGNIIAHGNIGSN